MSLWINTRGEVFDLSQPGEPMIDDGKGNNGEDDPAEDDS